MRNTLGLLLVLLWTVLGWPQAQNGEGPDRRQAVSEKSIAVSVCALIKNPKQYDGVHVVLRARVFDGMGHGILLLDKHCARGLKMLATQSIDDHEDYQEFEHALYAARRTRDHEITAEFSGRFVYRPAEPRLKWALDVERVSHIELLPRS